MDKYCCNCKYENIDDDSSWCNGCYEDNMFNAENWEEAILKEQKDLIPKDKILEFRLEGCIYSEKEVTLDELQEEFMDWCDSKGWEHCGMIKPLTFKEENNKNE